MYFEDIWAQLCRKRPSLNNPSAKVEIEADNFKALLKQVYEQGQKHASKGHAYAESFEFLQQIFKHN